MRYPSLVLACNAANALLCVLGVHSITQTHIEPTPMRSVIVYEQPLNIIYAKPVHSIAEAYDYNAIPDTSSKHEGLHLIMKYEKFKSHAYKDCVGVWTIGYGETHNVHKGDVISKRDAYALLVKRYNALDAAMYRIVPDATHKEHEAFIAFAYNVGLDAFKRSTMLRLYRANHKQHAANEFMRWVYAKGEVFKGLVTRRNEEMNLFNS